MAKLKKDPVTKTDIHDFLSTSSDFAFELKVLKLLKSLGFSCQHSGSYLDDNSNKIREFDIRASKTIEPRSIRLAVECKNLQPYFPLHICCVPREEIESSNYLIIAVDPDRFSVFKGNPLGPIHDYHYKTHKLLNDNSLYPINDPVGKSSDQVGRSDHDSSFISNDRGVYEKWAQALSSADDLVGNAVKAGINSDSGIDVSLILPILVIPDGMLWTTYFNENGEMTSEPSQVNRCSYFVDRNYDLGKLSSNEFKASHLEIVTLSGLNDLVDELFGNMDKINKCFPVANLVNEIKNIGK